MIPAFYPLPLSSIIIIIIIIITTVNFLYNKGLLQGNNFVIEQTLFYQDTIVFM